MIARMWHGRVSSEKAQAYHEYLVRTGLGDYAATAGNQGVFLLKREESGITHFYTLSFWENREAIGNFAGDTIEKARYYPEDAGFLLEMEPLVMHFDVLEKPVVFQP